jgi:hypothetical protein
MSIRSILRIAAVFAAAGCVQTAHAAINLVTNPLFEENTDPNNTHLVAPGGQNWTFTTGVTGAGSGIDCSTVSGSSATNTPYGAGCTNWDPYVGNQTGFLQGSAQAGNVTSILQVDSGFVIGDSYTLSFFAKGIAGFGGADPFNAEMIDGSTPTVLFGSMISPSLAGTGQSGYTPYSATFTATNTTETLEFYDAGGVTNTEVSWVDAISITQNPVPEPATATVLVLGAAGMLLGRRKGRIGRKNRLSHRFCLTSEPGATQASRLQIGRETDCKPEGRTARGPAFFNC